MGEGGYFGSVFKLVRFVGGRLYYIDVGEGVRELGRRVGFVG